MKLSQARIEPPERVGMDRRTARGLGGPLQRRRGLQRHGHPGPALGGGQEIQRVGLSRHGRQPDPGARERELLILRIGWLCQAEYEWGQHVLFGRQAGLSDEEIARIKKGPDDPAWDPFDASLLRAADELHAEALISDATWAALGERYNPQQLMDVVFTVGQYNLVSMALNTFGVQLDKGVKGF